MDEIPVIFFYYIFLKNSLNQKKKLQDLKIPRKFLEARSLGKNWKFVSEQQQALNERTVPIFQSKILGVSFYLFDSLIHLFVLIFFVEKLLGFKFNGCNALCSWK